VTLSPDGIADRLPHLPTIFAPGIISGPAHDSAPAFAPDGKTVYFTRSNAAQSTIFVSHCDAGNWQDPTIAPFSGEWNDMEPAFAPDGSYLVFVSNRPATAGGGPIQGRFNGTVQKGGNLWRVDRLGDGWSVPKRLPDAVNPNTSTFAPSVAADGSLWFMTTDEKSGRFRLFRAQYRDGHYLAAVPLPFSDGSSTDVDPAVAPDESFVVFGSGRTPGRGIDLFIVYREGVGWGTPQSLDEVNGPGSDAEARLSPDLTTLYFSSDRVTPVAFPRDRRQAEQDSARMQAWDNGNYNIWKIPLAPLRVAHPSTRGRSQA
jgi:Tol biopolymer transport system component